MLTRSVLRGIRGERHEEGATGWYSCSCNHGWIGARGGHAAEGSTSSSILELVRYLCRHPGWLELWDHPVDLWEYRRGHQRQVPPGWFAGGRDGRVELAVRKCCHRR